MQLSEYETGSIWNAIGIINIKYYNLYKSIVIPIFWMNNTIYNGYYNVILLIFWLFWGFFGTYLHAVLKFVES